MMTVCKYSEKIKADADQLMETTDIINNLSEFGQINIGGSYKYDLMWNPDIDIVVVCDNPRQKSVEALRKMVDLRLFQKYEYGDFEKFKRENRPESFILNLILPYGGQKWEIEIWFMTEYPENQRKIDELIESRLDDENRTKILEMKKSRSEKGFDKHSISSVDIYSQVLVS